MISEKRLIKISEYVMLIGLGITVFSFMGFDIVAYLGLWYIPGPLIGLLLLFIGILIHPEVLYNLKNPKVIVFLAIYILGYALLLFRYIDYFSRLV